MILSKVDLPQPEGPTTVTSSPLFGRSSTRKETSCKATLAAGPSPKIFVTFRKATNSGSPGLVFWPGAAGSGDSFGLFSSIWKQNPCSQPPKLIAGHRNQDNHEND